MQSYLWVASVFVLLVPFVQTVSGHHPSSDARLSRDVGSEPHLSRKSPPGFPPEAKTETIPVLTTQGWRFDWSRDGNNYALSSEQCYAAFPELYFEIDRAMNHWSGRTIHSKSIPLNEAGVRVLVHDEQIRVVQSTGMDQEDTRVRIFAVLDQLERAIAWGTEHGQIPDTEFTISVEDSRVVPLADHETIWSFTRSLEDSDSDGVWVIPDFTFGSSSPNTQAYVDMQDAARGHDSFLREKLPKVYLRSAEKHDSRLLRVTSNEFWAHVEGMSSTDGRASENDHHYCDYQMALATEDQAWSRSLTQILKCDTVPVVSDIRQTAHYYHLLQPHVNYIPVADDFSDLELRTRTLLWSTDDAQVIADNARKTFRERYTTSAAVACYWRQLLRRWSEVAFEPAVYQNMDKPGMKASGKLRGLSLREFISQREDVDYIVPESYLP